jgi:hypothetical protein
MKSDFPLCLVTAPPRTERSAGGGVAAALRNAASYLPPIHSGNGCAALIGIDLDGAALYLDLHWAFE